MTMITPSYLGETIEYSSLHACRSTLEDPTQVGTNKRKAAVDVRFLHAHNDDRIREFVLHAELCSQRGFARKHGLTVHPKGLTHAGERKNNPTQEWRTMLRRLSNRLLPRRSGISRVGWSAT